MDDSSDSDSYSASYSDSYSASDDDLQFQDNLDALNGFEDEEDEEEEEDNSSDEDDYYEYRNLKLISILQRKETYHRRTRKKIDELVKEFLIKTKDDIHDMLFNNNMNMNYNGLDSDRDTEVEVENTIRLFPDVLSSMGDEPGERGHNYPIQRLLYTQHDDDDDELRCNLRAVSFIPLVVRLSIEYECFGFRDQIWRGGLLLEDMAGSNVLHDLMMTNTMSDDDDESEQQQQQHELFDDKCILVMKQLRQMEYFKKEDIETYNLFHTMCNQRVIPPKRFRFLVEWDPTALTQPNDNGYLPLHYAAWHSNIQGFRMVFEYGIRYYPNKKGISLLFKKNTGCRHRTPIDFACSEHGRDKVMKIVEDILVDYKRLPSLDDDSATGPYDVVDALINAAIDENIHLDCVYFLIRRHPDVIVKLLSKLSSSAAAAAAAVSTSNDDDNDVDDITSKADNDIRIGSRRSRDSASNDDNAVYAYPKKRKRKQEEGHK
jgi:hypothetical protein